MEQERVLLTTEDFIRAARNKFRAPRGEKFISVGNLSMRVRTAGERVIHLPNGTSVKVETDASGHATQIEEDEHLHAIARPGPIIPRWRNFR